MNEIEIARKIVTSYVHNCVLNFEEQLVELYHIKEDNKYLLEHIEAMLEILNKAKQELEEKENE